MAIEDVPFKRAVRARMPPHVEKHPPPRADLVNLFQFRPDLPGVPALLKLRLGFLQARDAIRARHRAVDGHRPEPAQTVGTAARFVDTTDLPLASNDGVVRAVLVDPGTKIE